jgi:hypothetical protein
MLGEGLQGLSVRAERGDIAALWWEDLIPFRGIILKMNGDRLSEPLMLLIVGEVLLRLEESVRVEEEDRPELGGQLIAKMI